VDGACTEGLILKENGGDGGIRTLDTPYSV
jgi:hypothetical protein